jgi:thiol:disulfide interchange protein
MITFALFCLLLTVVKPDTTEIDYTDDGSMGTITQQAVTTNNTTTTATATTTRTPTATTTMSSNTTAASNTTMSSSGSAIQQQSIDSFFLTIGLLYLLLK